MNETIETLRHEKEELRKDYKNLCDENRVWEEKIQKQEEEIKEMNETLKKVKEEKEEWIEEIKSNMGEQITTQSEELKQSLFNEDVYAQIISKLCPKATDIYNEMYGKKIKIDDKFELNLNLNGLRCRSLIKLLKSIKLPKLKMIDITTPILDNQDSKKFMVSVLF